MNSSKQAHEFNLDAAQRELDSRNAQGEDVSHLRVNPTTAAIERCYDTRISRGHDGIEANTVIQLGYDGRELHIHTSKAPRGGISTLAHVMTRTADNTLTCVLFQDFSSRLELDRNRRCTQANIARMHAKALVGIDGVLAAAMAKHPPKAPANRFRFDGAIYTLESMLLVNNDDPALCDWLRVATVGECFSGCECVPSTTEPLDPNTQAFTPGTALTPTGELAAF